MPVYINILEDAHHKLLSTNLPLYNATLLVMATKGVFVLQEYPDVSQEWEWDPKDAKTWAAWEICYKQAYKLW